MATVTVTGTLTDFGLASLNGSQPRLIFRPSGPALKSPRILSTKEIVVTPASNGTFTVELEPMTGIRPDRTMDVSIEWLDAGTNYKSMDLVTDLRIPPGGGVLADIAALDYQPSDVWVSASPPDNPAISTWWLSTTTGDLYEWSA